MSYDEGFNSLADELYGRAKKIWPTLTEDQFAAAAHAAVDKLPDPVSLSNQQIIDATTTELNQRYSKFGKHL